MNDKFNSTLLPNPSTEREAAKYVGGEVRNLTEANNIHIVLAFEGGNYKQSLPLLVAEEILGNGRKIGRLQRNILNKHVFIDGAQALNVNYSDTGLFGIKVSGSASHVPSFLCRPKTSWVSLLKNYLDWEPSPPQTSSWPNNPLRAESIAQTPTVPKDWRTEWNHCITLDQPTNTSTAKSTVSQLSKLKQQCRKFLNPHSPSSLEEEKSPLSPVTITSANSSRDHIHKVISRGYYSHKQL